MGGLSDRPQEQRLEVTKVTSFEGNFLEDKLSGYTLNLGVHPIQLVPTFVHFKSLQPLSGLLEGR